MKIPYGSIGNSLGGEGGLFAVGVFLAEIVWGVAEVLFYVFAEKRQVVEVHFCGYFLDALVAVLEQLLYAAHNASGNEVAGGAAALLVADAGEVFWRHKQLVGKELHASLVSFVACQKQQEFVEQLIALTQHTAIALGEVLAHAREQVEGKTFENAHQRFAAVVDLRVLNLKHCQLVVLQHQLALVLRELHHRI